MIAFPAKRREGTTVTYPKLLVTSLILGALACGGERNPALTSPPPTDVTVPEAPPWDLESVRGDVYYEVFVRSFADSDGDGVGDLLGLTGKLDYLRNDLGVDGLWLMPVFESPSYHGYDVVDYDRVDREYGTDEDLARLCEEAERRGMKVIVDLVLNHTGAGHPWFKDPGKSDWYVWRFNDPGWTQPWGSGRTWHPDRGKYYYGLFWGGMPDLNWENAEVRDEMARVAVRWLDRGLDGFRLDATRHLVETGPGEDGGQADAPATFRVLDEFASRIRAHAPDALLVGENWTNAERIARYLDVLPMSFNFPLAGAIVESARTGEGTAVVSALQDMEILYPEGAHDAPFLTNHDMKRVATVLGGDERKMRLAASMLLTLPGTPFLYYGEEIGLRNGPGSSDEEKRTPMPWNRSAPGRGFTTGKPWYGFAPGEADVSSQLGKEGSLLSHYAALIRLRKEFPALAIGTLSAYGESDGFVWWDRAADGERLRVVHDLRGGDRPCPETVCAGAEVARVGGVAILRGE
jgi:glycosidase